MLSIIFLCESPVEVRQVIDELLSLVYSLVLLSFNNQMAYRT